MELKEFIQKTLVDIRNGLRNANEEIAILEGGKLGVNQAALFQIESRGGKDGKSYINFDIAVTVSGETQKNGVAGIRVAILDIGGETSDAKRQENISRIKFSLISSKNTG